LNLCHPGLWAFLLIGAPPFGSPRDAESTPEAAEAFRRLRHEALTAERLAVIGLRDDGVISEMRCSIVLNMSLLSKRCGAGSASCGSQQESAGLKEI
jgi:hypothetical protein